MSRMQTAILPVLDLMGGQIVRGIAGRRAEYRPIVSKLIDSAEPLAVARAIRDQFGFREFYLADLDAIRDAKPALDIYSQLHRDGFQLWLDAGIRSANDDILLEATIASIVVGSESIAGPDEVQDVIERISSHRMVFSLDLKAGQPLGCVDRWPAAEPAAIIRHAIETLGVRRVIVLDLANVGVGAGVSTEELCKQMKHDWPDVQLTAGGGVRGIEDVQRLLDIGVDRVLVASALHDGRITRAML